MLVSPGALAESDPIRSTIYVVSHGLHAGIVIPNPGLYPGNVDWPDLFPAARWLEIGWGDGKFYPDEDAGFLLGFRALMVPTDSVLHVVALPEPDSIGLPAENMLELTLTSSQNKNLSESIASTFALNFEGKPVELGPGRYGESRFYAANGSFHLFHNCNHWVIARLRDAGLDLDQNEAAALTGDSLLRQLREWLAAKRGTVTDDQNSND